MNVMGLICARGGSRGLPNKHLMPIAGKSLIQHVLEYVEGEGCSDVVLSSDDDRILELAAKHCNVLKRPEYLARPTTPIVDVVRHFIDQFPRVKYVMEYDGNWVRRPPLLSRCLQVLRPGVDIIQPLSYIQKEFPQWSVSMDREGKITPYVPDHPAGREGLPPLHYPHSGAMFIRVSAFKKHVGDNWPGERIGFLCEPGMDINSPHDYVLAKAVMERTLSVERRTNATIRAGA